MTIDTDLNDMASKCLTVWGGGYVGLSSAMHFAQAGHEVLVRDMDAIRVASINEGRAALPRFEEWVGFSLKELVQAGLICADLAGSAPRRCEGVHFIAVPTERDGEPWLGAVEAVFSRLRDFRVDLCIIESTCPPGTAGRLSQAYGVPIVVAPRRDWFLGEGMGLASLPRVIAGTSREARDQAARLLKKVSPNLLEAETCAVAELAKCLENSIHHVVAQHVTQVSRAYPADDVNAALSLAATHWRIGTRYFAGAGTGGYCVPVSTAFLRDGAVNQNVMSIGRSAVAFELDQREHMARVIAERASGPVGILGLAYRGDVPSATLSPFVSIARRLRELKLEVAVHEPYFSDDRIRELTDASPTAFPEGLADCQLLLVGPGHQIYRQVSAEDVWRYFRKGQCVLDNEGTWEHLSREFRRAGICYQTIGSGLEQN